MAQILIIFLKDQKILLPIIIKKIYIYIFSKNSSRFFFLFSSSINHTVRISIESRSRETYRKGSSENTLASSNEPRVVRTLGLDTHNTSNFLYQCSRSNQPTNEGLESPAVCRAPILMPISANMPRSISLTIGIRIGCRIDAVVGTRPSVHGENSTPSAVSRASK